MDTTERSGATGPEIVLYIQRGCAVCLQVKRFLEQHEVAFEIKWLSEPENLFAVEELARAHGVRGIPLLVVGNELVTGFQPEKIFAALLAAGSDLSTNQKNDHSLREAGEIALPSSALWVANLAAGTLSFMDPNSGSAAAADLAMGIGSMPIGIGHDPETGIAVVSDIALHRATFFDCATGGLLRETLDASSLTLPPEPGDIAVDIRRNRFYVSCAKGASVVALDSRSGSYVGGDLDRAATPLPQSTTNAIAFDPVLDRIFVRIGGTILALDAERRSLLTDGVWGSRDLGFGRDVKVNPENHLLYVPGYGRLDSGDEYHVLNYLDARTGDHAFGGPTRSTMTTDGAPWTVMPDPGADLVFVACMTSGSVQAFDASHARHARHGVSPTVETGPAGRSMALRAREHTLAVSSFDAATVTFLDSETNEYKFGSRTASTARTGEGPRAMVFVEPPTRFHA